MSAKVSAAEMDTIILLTGRLTRTRAVHVPAVAKPGSVEELLAGLERQMVAA